MQADDNALEALFVPFAEGALRWPAGDRVLFLNARDGFALREHLRDGWLCQQDFKPFAESLARAGAQVREPAGDERFALICLLPMRQRDAMRAQYARALDHLVAGGTLVASAANTQGAKSAESDLARLVGPVQHLSKHKCRVFWAAPRTQDIDATSLETWRSLSDARPIAGGTLVGRPGLFAWDRIDPASALLAEHLPGGLAGRAADFGAGIGYLAVEVLRRCPRVATVDLYEADARALEPARINLERAVATRGGGGFEVFWHDVTTGLPRRYDAIVSNPPFHVDRVDRPDLGRAFIERAADALESHGRLLLVANRHLPYEATLRARFATLRTLAEHGGYKVLEAREPRTA
jgi:16S rRNA (guanine1207-N2)-methyltransferase